MPARDAAVIGAPCWVDLSTTDTDRARTFYGRVFGWEAEQPAEEFGGYFNFTLRGVRIAGCMAAQPGVGVPDVWAVHLATDDAAKTLEAAVANGGQVLVPTMPVGDLGTMSVIADVGGAAVGAWQPGTHQGFGIVAEAGAPGWFELHTRAYDAAVAFYRDVFRWETHVEANTPEFRYTTLQYGDEQYAGIMDASGEPADAPARWSVYFGTDDADATLATIVEAGGSVVRPADDTPYGRLAVAADPMGAQFKLVAPNGSMPARES